jgi:hypothetical protein
MTAEKKTEWTIRAWLIGLAAVVGLFVYGIGVESPGHPVDERSTGGPRTCAGLYGDAADACYDSLADGYDNAPDIAP